MRMSMNEKKALYAFGCPNREATVERLRFAAALAPDPAAKKLFFTLAVKLSDEDCDRWYRCLFFNLRLEMEAYLRYEKAFERIVRGCPAEDCEDGMEYNEEWEDDEYDTDKG